MNIYSIFKSINQNTKLFSVIVIFILLFVGTIFIITKREHFDNIPLDGEKLIMITDKNGNIETLPLSSLHQYLKSIETDINTFKSSTTGVLSNMQTSVDTKINSINTDKSNISTLISNFDTFKSSITSRIDQIKDSYLKKGELYKIQLGTNFNTAFKV